MSRPRHSALREHLVGMLTRLGELRREAMSRGLPDEGVISAIRDAEQALDAAVVALAIAQRTDGGRQPELKVV